jgi:hypothetical protein
MREFGVGVGGKQNSKDISSPSSDSFSLAGCREFAVLFWSLATHMEACVTGEHFLQLSGSPRAHILKNTLIMAFPSWTTSGLVPNLNGKELKQIESH